jgi:hypothetical protein
MVMFSYVKMQVDLFLLFAELHQVEEMGPTLAIIPACEEAERIVHMMNKQVAAFLFYYLTTIAALPKKFVMELLKARWDATLVAEIDDCKWNPEMLTITTPHKQKEEEDMEELEKASWWNNAFNLKEIGKKNMMRAADKNPEKLFDLDADALSFATVHNRHLQPRSIWMRKRRMTRVRDRPPQPIPARRRRHARTPTRKPQGPKSPLPLWLPLRVRRWWKGTFVRRMADSHQLCLL